MEKIRVNPVECLTIDRMDIKQITLKSENSTEQNFESGVKICMNK